MMGNEMKIRNDGYSVIRVAAKETTGEGSRLLISLDSMTISMSMPMKDTTYSVEQLLGKRVSILLSPKGEVLEREIIDTVELGAEMMQYSNREAIQFLSFIPDKELKIGDTWVVNKVDTVEMLGASSIYTSETEYTLEGTENRNGYSVLKIPYKSKMTIEGEGNMGGFQFLLEGTGNSAGELYFAPKEGLPVHSESKLSYDMTLAGTGNQNIIIPITQETSQTRSLLK
jgi:hypothetical protein